MIGKRLLAVVRATDAVARMSRAGDEFSIVFDGVEDLQTARHLADRVASRISQPITLSESGETIVMTASIGGVVIERGTTSSPDQLFHLADARMLRSKSTYGGPVFMGQDDAAALADRKRDRRGRR
jgi:diguanylate cyclase (GGDEF)-like protein